MSEFTIFNLVHNITSFTDTHRITYLQNSVVGKSKEMIQAYSCDLAYNPIALKELMDQFGDLHLVVNAFIDQMESWMPGSQTIIKTNRVLYLSLLFSYG